MLSKIFTYLKHEHLLLSEMVMLSEKQHFALIKFNTYDLDEIASYQEELARSLKNAEEQRIQFLMSVFDISMKETRELKLSELDNFFEPEEQVEIRKLREELSSLIMKLNFFNTTNRALANRALGSVREILSVFTNGTNRLCNVTV
jgi:hypothetical protein